MESRPLRPYPPPPSSLVAHFLVIFLKLKKVPFSKWPGLLTSDSLHGAYKIDGNLEHVAHA